MGGEFWSYVVPYQENIQAALEKLREQEFQAGRFWQPSEVGPGFFGRMLGRGPSKPKPPATIREAIKLSEATGTRSILDMERISDTPALGAVSAIPPDELQRLFGTAQPTLDAIEHSDEFVEGLERGQGVYIVLYRDGKPDGIYFAGYSYD
ncbi:conserved hypothetical protein [Verrucomicrobia bacterium]|nr:conserved hypothetical protein [Verrucomicrobiota bacterium]